MLKHYPQRKSEAFAYVDFNIGQFRDMKIQPYLEQALKHKVILRA